MNSNRVAGLIAYAEQLSQSDHKDIILRNLHILPNLFHEGIEEGHEVEDHILRLVESHRDAYFEFIESEDHFESISQIENRILDYNKKYKSHVDNLLKKISQKSSGKMVDGYLGSGSNSSAYEVQIDGQSYAFKVYSHARVEFEALPLQKAQGISNVPVLHSFSILDQVMIMNKLEGKDMSKYPINEKLYIDDETIDSLIKTVIQLHDRGIDIDPKASNFIYEPGNTIQVIDFHLSNGTSTLPQKIIDLSVSLTGRGDSGFQYPDGMKPVTYYYNQTLDTTVKFLKLLKNKYPHILDVYEEEYLRHGSALKNIDKSLVLNTPINVKIVEELESLGYSFIIDSSKKMCELDSSIKNNIKRAEYNPEASMKAWANFQV